MHVGIANLQWQGKTFPAFPAHAQPAVLRIWQESHCLLLPLTHQSLWWWVLKSVNEKQLQYVDCWKLTVVSLLREQWSYCSLLLSKRYTLENIWWPFTLIMSYNYASTHLNSPYPSDLRYTNHGICFQMKFMHSCNKPRCANKMCFRMNYIVYNQ